MDTSLTRKQTQNIQDKIIKRLDTLPDRPIITFSEFDDMVIRKYYPAKGSCIAEHLGKTKKQIRHRAEILGVKRR